MGTPTDNYQFSLPTLSGDKDSWGVQLNGNWTLLDTELFRIDELAQAAFPSDGTGVVTAPLTVETPDLDTLVLLSRQDGPAGDPAGIHLADDGRMYFTVQGEGGSGAATIEPLSNSPDLPEDTSIVTKARADARYFNLDGDNQSAGTFKLQHGIHVTLPGVGNIRLTRTDLSKDLIISLEATTGRPSFGNLDKTLLTLNDPDDDAGDSNNTALVRAKGDRRYLKRDETGFAVIQATTGNPRRASGSVAGASRISAGYYQVSLGAAAPNTQYAVQVTLETNGVDTNIRYYAAVEQSTKTTTSFRVRVVNFNGTPVDVNNTTADSILVAVSGT